MHVNVQGLPNKINDIELFLENFKNVDVICITEHWLKPLQYNSISLPGYTIATCFCRTSHIRGGALVFVRNNVNFTVFETHLELCAELLFECCAVRLDEYNLVIICVYRTPHGDIKVFFEKLEYILEYHRRSRNIIICGDFNIDILEESRNKQNFLSLLRSFSITPTISTPTRVTPLSRSCIDNVLTNIELVDGMRTLNTIVDFSDHNVQLLGVPTTCTKCDCEKSSKCVRKYNTKNNVNFLNSIQNISWDSLYRVSRKNCTIL